MLSRSKQQASIKQSSIKGFTLIEVMVALFIIGLAIPALLIQMSTMSNSLLHTREVTIAHWVAENRLQEVYLEKQIRNIKPRGRQAGDTDMAGVKWDWRTEVEPQAIPGLDGLGLLRIWVRVSKQGEDDILAEISGYLLED